MLSHNTPRDLPTKVLPSAPLRPPARLSSLFYRTPIEPRAIGSAAERRRQPRPALSCSCKKSNCLKLYCECFANGIYCDAREWKVEDEKELGKEGRDDACRCKCEGCYNNLPHEAIRREAIEGILVRNPDAFRPKILQAGVPQSDLRGEIRVKKEEGGEGGAGRGGGEATGMKSGDGVPTTIQHQKGCHCKRSHCLKRYCECFQAGIACGPRCRCSECRNSLGSAAGTSLQADGPATSDPLPAPCMDTKWGCGIVGREAGRVGGEGPAKRQRLEVGVEEEEEAGAGGFEILDLSEEERRRLKREAGIMKDVLKPQMLDDVVRLMVKAAWEEGVKVVEEEGEEGWGWAEGNARGADGGEEATSAQKGGREGQAGQDKDDDSGGKGDERAGGGGSAGKGAGSKTEAEPGEMLECREESQEWMEGLGGPMEEEEGSRARSVGAAVGAEARLHGASPRRETPGVEDSLGQGAGSLDREERRGTDPSAALPSPSASSAFASRLLLRQEVAVLETLDAALDKIREMVEMARDAEWKQEGRGGWEGENERGTEDEGSLRQGAGGREGGVGETAPSLCTYAYARRM